MADMTAPEVTDRGHGTPCRALLSRRRLGPWSVRCGSRLLRHGACRLLRHGACRLGTLVEQPAEPGLVEHRDAELAGVVRLAPRVLADDDEVRLLRDAARRLAAPGQDGLFRLVAAEALEAARDDDGHPLEGALDRLVALVLHPDAGGGPLLDDPLVPVDV